MLKGLWDKISYAGVKKTMELGKARRVILINRISIILFVLVMALRSLVVVFGFQPINPETIITFLPVFLILVIPYFNLKGLYRLNAFLYSILPPLFTTFFSIKSQNYTEIVNINHYYIPRIFILAEIVLPLILIEFKDKKLLYFALSVNVGCTIAFNTVIKYIGVPFNPETVSLTGVESITYFVILVSMFIIVSYIFLNLLNQKYEKEIIGLNNELKDKNHELESFNEEIKSQRDLIANKNHELEQYNEEIISQRDQIYYKNEQLEKANEQIEAIYKELTDSMQYAQKIQSAVLGADELPKKYFSESFIYYNPKTYVSGDFYYYKEFVIRGEKCLITLAADCTGHGVPGGFLSMLGISLLSEILQGSDVINAADVLNQLRVKIKNNLKQKGLEKEQKDGMDVAICIYYPDTKEMDYAGARNPLLLIKSDKSLSVIKADRQPIGIYEREKKFDNHRIQLNTNDMVYIFSDGLQDQFGGHKGKKLKFRGLQELLKSISDKPCITQKELIDAFYKDWTYFNTLKEFDQTDDIVLIGMKV